MKAPEPPTIRMVPQSSIAEVAAHARVARELQAWAERHPKAYSELKELASEYNATAAAADMAVRTAGVSVAPFELYTFVRSDDGEVLYEEIGRQRFAAMGGKLETKETKTVDRKRFDALVAIDKLSAELVAKVVSWSPRYHKPDKLVLP